MKKSNLRDKNAFTMVEVVFVIVMIGILAAVIIPRVQNSRLREAADQIVSHIRYTQHLAMIDDKFGPADADWYKKRWQILFEQDSDLWSYTIFSDGSNSGTLNGNPEEVEIARNPQDSSKRLTGGSVLGAINSDSQIVTKDLNIGRTYGITGADSIEFTNCKDGDAHRIVFDYMGRPMSGNPNDYTQSYSNAELIKEDLCKITIKDSSGDSLEITIQPETGFAEIN
jgi:prepilin-type N-terminal cleavage/methylation domain-containing protein